MPLFQILVAALIQGLTEFLPISSSGHLILLPSMTGGPDQGLVIDIAVHLGTLLAVTIYFRSEVSVALRGVAHLMTANFRSAEARLAICLAIATVPLVGFGAALALSGATADLRSPFVIAWAMIIFGLILWWAERTGAAVRSENDWTMRDAIVMGLWQAIALIPGTSRSGITITAALRLGFDRRASARLAMFMSIPAILASGFWLVMDMASSNATVRVLDVALATGFAFIAGLLALSLMMRLLQSVSFTPYVIYRVVLGVAILVWIA